MSGDEISIQSSVERINMIIFNNFVSRYTSKELSDSLATSKCLIGASSAVEILIWTLSQYKDCLSYIWDFHNKDKKTVLSL